MFTGIIEGLGEITAIRRLRDDMRVTIAPLFDFTDCRLGDSVAVDGVCLTVNELENNIINMDVSGETLSLSTLTIRKEGDKVNLERALRLTDRLGGHLVSGHVDGIGKILKKETQQRSWILKIGINERISRYTIQKGSIAVDGISLTINQREQTYFKVNIIPQTGNETTLLNKKVGDPVNIETDLIGKYVENFFLKKNLAQNGKPAPSVDMEMLIKQGFVN